jgi:hypothetical protein
MCKSEALAINHVKLSTCIKGKSGDSVNGYRATPRRAQLAAGQSPILVRQGLTIA